MAGDQDAFVPLDAEVMNPFGTIAAFIIAAGDQRLHQDFQH